MMDSELKKSSIRANRLEKKRFELMMSAFDTAKRNVAVDMKKSQLDFRRRLKRYKDRQREILLTRSGSSSNSMEEFVLRQLARRTQMHTAQSARRPQTCPNPTGALRSAAASRVGGPGAAGGAAGGAENPVDEEEEDSAPVSHCRRSKVDLRPCTAWTAVRSSFAKADSLTSTRPNPNTQRLLLLRGGGLGTPAKQVRYFDEEEIEERCTFYRFLLDGFRHIEHQRLESLNDRVEEFCGKASGRQPSCPPLVNLGLVTLPPGVPPMVAQAMRVKIPHASLAGHLQRAKTQ